MKPLICDCIWFLQRQTYSTYILHILSNHEKFNPLLIFCFYLKSIFDIPKLRQNCPGQDEPSRDCNKPFPCSFCLVGLWPEPSLGRNISPPPCNCSGNSEHNPENGRLWLHLYRKLYVFRGMTICPLFIAYCYL